jgi:hypothetical protein
MTRIWAEHGKEGAAGSCRAQRLHTAPTHLHPYLDCNRGMSLVVLVIVLVHLYWYCTVLVLVLLVLVPVLVLLVVVLKVQYSTENAAILADDEQMKLPS